MIKWIEEFFGYYEPRFCANCGREIGPIPEQTTVEICFDCTEIQRRRDALNGVVNDYR
jgi:hypothetical protein